MGAAILLSQCITGNIFFLFLWFSHARFLAHSQPIATHVSLTSVKKPKPTGKQTPRIDKDKISAFLKRKRAEDDQILLDKQTMDVVSVVANRDFHNLGELMSISSEVPCK